MLELLQVVVAIAGGYAIYLAIKHVIFFARSRRRIGRSMVFMLVEQVVSAGGTLAFSANSLMETLSGGEVAAWNAIDARLAIGIRLVMFAAMIHATTHVADSVKEVLEDMGHE